jgi:DNA repair protein RadC
MISTEGHRQRLRTRFEKSGLAGFAPHEIIELILTLAIPRKDVKEPAKLLLKKYGSLRNVLDADLSELREIHGVGTVTPIALKIIKEIASLYLEEGVQGSKYGTEMESLVKLWQVRIGSSKTELFEVAYFDSGLRLMIDGIETLEEGTIDRSSVYPRKVVESALRKKSAALVFAHNHPNGIVQPTEEDKLLTRALTLAAATVQIQVLDHLIISDNNHFSFRKEGLL